MINAISKVAWRIQKTGLGDTCRWLGSHISTWRREQVRGIDTRGKLHPDTRAVDQCNGYEPIMYECLDCIFDALEISGDDVLIDYGSGKGRVLIEASLRNFKRIEGVEYDLKLVEQSEANIRNFQPQLLDNQIFVHHCDARDYEIPMDATHIFLWNSFEGEVLDSVVSRIKAFVHIKKRPLKLVLALPSGETASLSAFAEFGEPTAIETRFWTGADLYLYQLVAK